jgi:hypothetical protein
LPAIAINDPPNGKAQTALQQRALELGGRPAQHLDRRWIGSDIAGAVVAAR